MTRTIDGTTKGILDSKTSKMILLVSLDFGSDGWQYFTSSGQQIMYNSNLYLGAGGALSISEAEESVDNQSYGLQFGLSGISDPDGVIMAKALTLNYRNKTALLHLATLNDNYAVDGIPLLIFAGRMDFMNISIGKELNISVSTSSRLTDWETPHGGRYTQGYQQSRVDASDFGFDYVQQLIHQIISWGVEGPSSTLINVSGTGAGIPIPREGGGGPAGTRDGVINPPGGSFGGGGGRCFEKGTLFMMADGTLKKIEDIEIYDIMVEGGKVNTVSRGDGLDEPWFDHRGVIVTGYHKVRSDGIWMNVRDSQFAVPTETRNTTYMIVNENHRMVSANGQYFTDQWEADDPPNWTEYVLEQLNGQE